VRPAAAVIPVGEGNRFGHPRPATLGALAAAGVPVWRTDLHGDVTVTPAEPGVAVATGG
jgi:competence protein ComEC